ncbi:MAG: hypothetical protein R3C02_06485 [Planctomycetaceae bacterium]
MEVEFDLSVDDAAEAFGEALGFVVCLAGTNDLVEGRAGGDGERGLVDDLISWVELRAQ